MKFTTIMESHIAADLLVAKSLLESEGIDCFLKNEYTTQVFDHMPTFNVELQVYTEDLELAKKILEL